MKVGDLTTLGNVNAWLATTNYIQQSSGQNTNIQNLLSQLISRWSGAILAELERPSILPRAYVNETYDGPGSQHLFLKNWPVTSIQQVAINGFIIQPAPIVPSNVPQPPLIIPGYGYRFEEWEGIPPGGPQAVDVIGTYYYMGKQNVQISYTAGYQVTGEPWTIPAPSTGTTSTITVLQPYGIWAQDVGVVYTGSSGSAALTLVTGAPAAKGQYQVLPPDIATVGNPNSFSPPGQYVFFTGPGGDTGSTVGITYGFIPAALEQIAIELVCERFLYRGRIGEVSRSINQQVSVRYDDSEFPKYAMPVLQRYRSILPIR